LPELAAEGARVLLAEDHPTNRMVVELLLKASGAELTTVADGAQAVEAFKQGGFDLVLMDIQMPVMDGLAATRAIRLHELACSLERTPLVALTANALPEHIQASVDAGADAHLAKPITAGSLLPLIDTLLRPQAPSLQAAGAA
jgi:CheY-like chemotaxis protein